MFDVKRSMAEADSKSEVQPGTAGREGVLSLLFSFTCYGVGLQTARYGRCVLAALTGWRSGTLNLPLYAFNPARTENRVAGLAMEIRKPSIAYAEIPAIYHPYGWKMDIWNGKDGFEKTRL